MVDKPPDLVVAPKANQDVKINAPTGHTFSAEPWGWTNDTKTSARVVGPIPVGTTPPEPEPPEPQPEPGDDFILIPKADLMKLPTSGAAWTAMKAAADSVGAVNLNDQNGGNDVKLLAAALVAVRQNEAARLAAVKQRLAAGIATTGDSQLAFSRNLHAFVLAADLVGYREAAFLKWVADIRSKDMGGRTLISNHNSRPNNWGTHGGASRIAADLFLREAGKADLALAIKTFRGWLGDRSQYAGFKYSDPMSWHANESAPVGINPKGSVKQGHNIDGVLPDDQRRAGGFAWPPPKENYAYEALQGALMQAELLHQAGYPAYDWSDKAIARAYAWLYTVCGFPAEGDDTWQVPLVNERCGTSHPVKVPVQSGKNMGYTDWLYG